MQYTMPDLLQQTAWLAEQYTSKDASSITYETANRMMEAVLYCVKENEQCGECEKSGKYEPIVPAEILSERAVPDIKTAYERGYQAVLFKVNRTRMIYEDLISDFEDYGCRNYRDTITKGIPGFFIRYNAKFCPQDQILTLDYPVLGGNTLTRHERVLCGVDLIHEYMGIIQVEKRFLDCFDRQAVVSLMNAIYPEYEELYLDNLCYPVLLNALGCLFAGRSAGLLEIGLDGLSLIENKFKGRGVQELTEMLLPCIRTLTKGSGWFDRAAALYAPRIENAVRFGRLDRLFQT